MAAGGSNIRNLGVLRDPFCVSVLAAGLAIALPAVVPMGGPPLGSFYTEATALMGWGLWLAWQASQLSNQPGLAIGRGGVHVRAAGLTLFGALVIAAAASMVCRELPYAIGVRHMAVLVAAGAAFFSGTRLARFGSAPAGVAVIKAMLWVVLIAGSLNALMSAMQYFHIDGPWQPMGKDGRAGGGMGQPNLLGTLLLWALVALVVLLESGELKPRQAWAIAGLLLLGLGFSASRTAALSCAVLAVWGVWDRQLKVNARALLAATAPMLAMVWLALSVWQGAGGPAFAGPELFHKADPSSSRWQLWRQCLLLIQAHPWVGVGWGQFNMAWTLTPMPSLPRTAGYTFTHAHNLVLHWAVELGLATTAVLLGLMAYCGWQCARGLWAQRTPVVQRAAWVMVAVVLLHSQFEFPLWYANLLLPTAFLAGLSVPTITSSLFNGAPVSTARRLRTVSLAIALAAAAAFHDYRPVAQVYQPSAAAAEEAVRMERGKASWLFGHFVDRLSSTTVPVAQRRIQDYQVVAFEMIDLRLLASWSQTLAQHGQGDQARYLIDRLREFDGPSAQAMLTGCGRMPAFDCLPAQFEHDWTEFRRQREAGGDGDGLARAR